MGRYKNAGRAWRPQGKPEKVKVHDFLDPEQGKAIPYGVYDLGRNLGWVSVGTPEVRCVLDTRKYPKNLKHTEQQMTAINLKPNNLHGDWNYTILPNGQHYWLAHATRESFARE